MVTNYWISILLTVCFSCESCRRTGQVLFVACRGFEPLFFDRKVNRPEPLDEHAICFLFYKDKKNFSIYQIFFYFFYLDLVVYLLSACNWEDYCIIRLLTSKPILFYKDKETFSFHQIFFYFYFKELIRRF